MGIEKIGLPAKPAAKGSSWVLDASSCQACQTPFSLFNRKHHCRRCGGLFCGTCSNSKLILRSQGDIPVRVCEPCKKLEEAARFQLRNRGKQNKGALKGSSVGENEAFVNDLLGDHGMDSLVSGGSELIGDEADVHHSTPEVSPSKDKVIEPQEESTSPEKLRDQAVEQKRIYATLKREGRNSEALQAFKRHKELTREADALELSLKKAAISQRRALAEGIASTGGPVQKPNKESPESEKDPGRPSTAPEKVSSRDSATGRKANRDGADDDLLNALKGLGWQDTDLSEKVKKGPMSDMDLLAEISDSLPKDASAKKPAKQSPTQLEILAHKRQAVALKREGKPAEAKEELKKAKILERKLEEMALFEDENEDEDDDDDELAALMRSLNKEAKMGTGKQQRFPPAGGDIPPLSFSLAEDDDDDPNVDVTDDDINDPSIIAALRSMGWKEEAATMERSRDPKTGGSESFHIAESVDKEASLQREILTHKRRAVALKHEGNIAEAKIELQEAKGLEQKLEALKSQPIRTQPIRSTSAGSSKLTGGPPKGTGVRLEDVVKDLDDEVEVDEDDMRDPDMIAALKAMGFEEEDPLPPLQAVVKPSPLEKKNLKDEILSIKRSALALKKQGKNVEAREELRQAKILEEKLEKMQKNLEANSLPPPVTTVAKQSQRGGQIPLPDLIAAGVVSEDEEEEVQVSADDFVDPDLVEALKSVGWQDEDTFVKDKEPEKEALSDSPPIPVQEPYKAVKLPPKDHARKLQLQKELLAHKRRALALKREGKAEEAKLELAQGKILEKEMEKIENAALNAGKDPQPKQSTPAAPNPLGDESDGDEDVTDEDMRDPELLNALQAFGWKPEPEKTPVVKDDTTLPAPQRVENAKLDVANPPYTKAVTEPEPAFDPIWHSIMKSASISHNQAPDMVSEKTKSDSLLVDYSVEGEYGDKGSSRDLLPPLFDDPSSAPKPPKAVSGQTPAFDLLSGGAWDKTHAENVPEKDDSDSEEEDDVFDSGLLAALQSIGLGPPSKPSSSVQLEGDAANVKSEGKNQRIQQTRSAVSRGQQKDSVPDWSTGAEPVESSARVRPGRVEAVGRVPVPPPPAQSVSGDHDAAGPSSKNYASTADTDGGTTPSIQEEIKMHKRKALALKREGKTSEAREELREAKILEKQLEMGSQSSTEEHQSPDGVSKTGGTISSESSPEKPSQTLSPDKPPQATPSHHAQSHKEQVRQELRQGKDRKKLQQESLAHKRKALGLRREGKVDEADAEFELAKTLEKQMEDLDQQMGKTVAPQEDMGMVEGLLDPQLMAALKGVGFNDVDLHHGEANVNRVSAGPPSVSKSDQAPRPQAGQSSTNRPPNTIPTNVQRKNTLDNSHESQLREGRSTSAASLANTVKEERIPNRASQPIQSAGGRGQEEDIVGLQRGSSKGGAGSSSNSASQVQRKQLEDKIKREKVKALELKRAGRQGEAVEILRGAKRLEKELQAMAS